MIINRVKHLFYLITFHNKRLLFARVLSIADLCVPSAIQVSLLFAFDNISYSKRWNNILSECSFKLMPLIVSYEYKKLHEMKTLIDNLRISIEEHLSCLEFMDLDKKTQEKINKVEESIMHIKNLKFNRDVHD